MLHFVSSCNLFVLHQDPNSVLATPASRAAEIFGPLDVDKDGEITMDEFVDGYMKIHTLSNGKRRWSRKASMLEKVSEEDLEKLRMKMDSAMGGKTNSKESETNSKDNKDGKTNSAKTNANDKIKGVKNSEKESEKKSNEKGNEKKSKK